jgi:DNA/RNA-binding domain of Phe-tRNA-synthetase-like protein
LSHESPPTFFRIDPTILARFPDVQVGVLLARGVNNFGEREQIIAALRAEEDKVRSELAGTSPADHPRIAPWREAYRAFGANPKKYPSSIENLVSRVIRGNPIRHINKLVDIYNTISLRYILPVGGEDLDKMQGDILLTIATETEAPVTLLGEDEPRAPQTGEVIYKDSMGAICRRWNWKEADRTKLTEQTTNVILVLEALPPVNTALLTQATNDLARMIQTWCGGQVSATILDAEHPQLELLS